MDTLGSLGEGKRWREKQSSGRHPQEGAEEVRRKCSGRHDKLREWEGGMRKKEREASEARGGGDKKTE